jgi:mRNA interferase MazF
MNLKRGDIVLANLEPAYGSEQGKIRPCIVIQNDIANKYGPTIIIVPTTTSVSGKEYPTEAIISPEESGLKETSAVLCNQIRTISIEDRILKKIGTLKPEAMQKVNEALKTSLALE